MEQAVLTQEGALRAYATMLNTLNVAHLEPMLAEDFHYSSQMVFSEITSKAEYVTYITAKLAAIRNSTKPVFAEMGRVKAYFKDQPCVVMAQVTRENLVGLVLVEVARDSIKRLDFCIVPPPQQAIRTGEYPGLTG